MDELRQENEQLRQKIAELTGLLGVAEERIKQLTALLNQNSRNSSWPSSRDKGRKRTQSQRKKSERAVGGQKGHKGHTLTAKPNPDKIEVHKPSKCEHCQHLLGEEAEISGVRKRQVLKLPPLKFTVIEHQAETVVCKNCGQETRGQFPEGVSNPVQYDANVKQLAVYLKAEQLLPYERERQLLSDVFELPVSVGSLQNFMKKADEAVEPVVAAIGEAVKESEVVHADETGFYIEGERHWLHTASTEELSYYAAHPNRGQKAVDEIGILPACEGVLVHDAWPTYFKYKQADHALCNAHLLRELTAVVENAGHVWAQWMLALLLAVKLLVADAFLSGDDQLPPEQLTRLHQMYDTIVSYGLQEAPLPAKPSTTKGRRGRVKKSKARNLVERFEKHKKAILRFAHDFNVPFDNNLAERDIRMMKVQQKISGHFRSQEGAAIFCRLRSYTATLRKQGKRVWHALGSLFSKDEVIKPDFTPV